jgi:CRP-like cAMP-binding protein
VELDQAKDVIAAWAREQFGVLIGLGDVTVTRGATGRIWAGELSCATSDGEVIVGIVEVGEKGEVISAPTTDQVIDALVAAREPSTAEQPAAAEDDFSDLGMDDDFSDIVDEIGGSRESVFDTVDPTVIEEMVESLVASGEREKIVQARDLLPQLLTRHEGRGHVLTRMGELELLLGELELGLNYLEAAAREFADVADVDALGHVAELTLQVLGEQKFTDSPIKLLLDRSRARLRPIDKLDQAPVFIGLGPEELFDLEGMGHEMTLPKEADLLREGEPAVRAFVVKSGILSIRLSSPDGGSRVVRSCFPGDFLGESSVLGAAGATCNATVRAECLTTLWQFEGARLKQMSAEFPDIKLRIESARTLHRLDSFMSMHEATSALDVAVRDQVLACINGIRRVATGEILSSAGAVPVGVWLVADGQVELRVADRPPRIYGSNTFTGLRDTLHELELEGDIVAAADSLLVSFDPGRLKKLAADATPEVVAVLEKLE